MESTREMVGGGGWSVGWLAALAVGLFALAAGPCPASAQGDTHAQAAAPEAAGAALPDTWYAQALAYSESGINVTHFWSKGSDKLRAETVVAGHQVVTIVNGNTYYAYDLLSREGLAIGRSPVALKQDATRGRPFGKELDAVIRLGGERIGEETLAGQPVQVYQVTDSLGQRKLWVSDDSRQLPIRLKLFRRATGQTLHTDFLNWARGLPIADAYFEPEPDVKLLRLSFDEYLAKQGDREALGPVPVLYTDLLHGY
jgi:outer membrane lipoprotein-sorting protein